MHVLLLLAPVLLDPTPVLLVPVPALPVAVPYLFPLVVLLVLPTVRVFR